MLTNASEHCLNCLQREIGQARILPDGLVSSGVVLVGDSPYKDEIRLGRNFSGAAGYLLERLIRAISRERSEFGVANSMWCCPPSLGWTDKFAAAPALSSCRAHLDEYLASVRPRCIVPMGNVALRRICDITGIEAHHGYVHETPYGLAVPTFHPAYLIRGTSEVEGVKSRNMRYFPVVVFALQRALEVASGRWQRTPVEYLLDPRLEEAKAYVERCRERQLADTTGLYSFSCSNVVSGEHSLGGAHVAPTPDGQVSRSTGITNTAGDSGLRSPAHLPNSSEESSQQAAIRQHGEPCERHQRVYCFDCEYRNDPVDASGERHQQVPTGALVPTILPVPTMVPNTILGEPDAAVREDAGVVVPNLSTSGSLSGDAGGGVSCQGWLSAARVPLEGNGIPLLFLDLETPESSAFEGQEEEPPQFAGRRLKLAGPIIRCSFSLWPGTAVSFPWQEPFISWAKGVIQHADTIAAWNGYDADFPKLRAEGVLGENGRRRTTGLGVLRNAGQLLVDAMWAWHFLQSDLPKALGFVAPFFYDGPAWKHRNVEDPAWYNAVDSDAGLRCLLGVRQALEKQGRWERFMRHCTQTQPIFERMGFIQVDREQQGAFQVRLKGEYDIAYATLQTKAPDSVKPVKRWKRPPKDMAGVRAVKVPTGEHQGLLPLEAPSGD